MNFDINRTKRSICKFKFFYLHNDVKIIFYILRWFAFSKVILLHVIVHWRQFNKIHIRLKGEDKVIFLLSVCINAVVMLICTNIMLEWLYISSKLKWFYTGSKRRGIDIFSHYITITTLLVVDVLLMNFDESYNVFYKDALSGALVIFGIAVGASIAMFYYEYFKWKA